MLNKGYLTVQTSHFWHILLEDISSVYLSEHYLPFQNKQFTFLTIARRAIYPEASSAVLPRWLHTAMMNIISQVMRLFSVAGG